MSKEIVIRGEVAAATCIRIQCPKNRLLVVFDMAVVCYLPCFSRMTKDYAPRVQVQQQFMIPACHPPCSNNPFIRKC